MFKNKKEQGWLISNKINREPKGGRGRGNFQTTLKFSFEEGLRFILSLF